MARPRGEIPEPYRKQLLDAVFARDEAEAELKNALRLAINAGGSYREVAKAAGIALSTLQKIVPPRKDQE